MPIHIPNKKSAEPAFLTIKELASRWRLSTRQVHRIIAREQLPVFGPGRIVRIALKDIMVFEATNTAVR